jgi:hypothetical protein
MILRKVGFFCNSPRDTGIPKALVNSCGALPFTLRAPVAAYLRSGNLLAIGGVFRDWFDPSKVIGEKQYLSDGVWVWTGDVAYYVERYGVSVPQEFLDHMASQSWVAKPLGPEALREACDAFAQLQDELGFTRGDPPPPGAVKWRKS